MFKFNFNVETENCEDDIKPPFEKEKESDCTEKLGKTIDWYQSEEVKPTEAILANLDLYELNAKSLNFGNTEIQHLIAGFILEDIKDNGKQESKDIKTAEENHSDLIPGVYEGGAKVWECTDDLLLYLTDNFTPIHWASKNVLDLGCGSGLLGIYALRNGSTVHFQDYNKDVLEQITIPNVLLNLEKSLTDDEKLRKLKLQTKFFSGDWSHFVKLTTKLQKYDFILTSETIYNIENQQKILNTFKSLLAPNGLVLVAAKSHYFGVGGGLEQFKNFCALDKTFIGLIVWQAIENLKRGILQLKFQ